MTYRFFCLFCKVNPYKMTFASYRSNELSGNLYYVWQEVHKHYPQYTCHFSFKKLNSTRLGKISYVFYMIKATYALATSAYFIIDDYYFVLYVIKPRPRTTVVQLWHASGALKKFGYSTIGKSDGPSERYLKHVPIHSNYSKVYVSSTEIIPYYAEAFNMSSDRIYPFGVPRTDVLLSEELHNKTLRKFYEDFPQLKGKKLILYAPTYRGKSHNQGYYKIPLDLQQMYEKLGDDYTLIMHLHPYMNFDRTVLQGLGDFVLYIKKEYDIQELLVLADLLITDYSTVFFDYSLLNRPIAFFAHDLDEYIKDRDFYYQYEEIIPGPLFVETCTLIDWIKQGNADINHVVAFKKRFFDFTDGKASERIVKDFLEYRNG